MKGFDCLGSGANCFVCQCGNLVCRSIVALVEGVTLVLHGRMSTVQLPFQADCLFSPVVRTQLQTQCHGSVSLSITSSSSGESAYSARSPSSAPERRCPRAAPWGAGHSDCDSRWLRRIEENDPTKRMSRAATVCSCLVPQSEHYLTVLLLTQRPARTRCTSHTPLACFPAPTALRRKGEAI